MMLVFAFAQKAPKSFHMLNPEKPLPGLLAERPGPSPAETSGPALATRPTPWFAQTRHQHSSWQQDLPSATRDDGREVLHCSRTTSRRWGCHHHTPQHQHHSPRGSLGTLVQGREGRVPALPWPCGIRQTPRAPPQDLFSSVTPACTLPGGSTSAISAPRTPGGSILILAALLVCEV